MKKEFLKKKKNFKTENELLEVETNSSKELKKSKSKLNNLQIQLDEMLDKIEKDIDENKKLTKEIFRELKKLVKKLLLLKKSTLKNMVKINQFKVTLLKEKKELKILMLN